MGQKQSSLGRRLSEIRLPIIWILRNQRTAQNPTPQEPIKFQYKTRRKTVNRPSKRTKSQEENLVVVKSSSTNFYHLKETNNKTNNRRNTSNKRNPPVRTRSEPSLYPSERKGRSLCRIRNVKGSNFKDHDFRQAFGYEIEDVDRFLMNATIEKPANIPVVLAFHSILYQTRAGGLQAEIQLPLGMVVNAVFKNENWLYVQTPHAVEGYVSYAACLPLGIIPPQDNSSLPLWETNTDVFPKPCGNLTDTEKLSSRSECSSERCSRFNNGRSSYSACDERNVDRLYLKATARSRSRGTMQRHTLLVITTDYVGDGDNTISVTKGDVVSVLKGPIKNWLWIRTKGGNEGFIPTSVAGHGFL